MLSNPTSETGITGRPVLETDGLTAAYGREVVLRDVNLCLNANQLVGLIGPNGAGKSSLLKAILGVVSYNGRITLEGQPAELNRRSLSYVPQRENVRWDFPVSVSDVVMMGRYRRLGWLRRPGQADRALVAEALAQVEMSEFSQRQINQLSGGQQQRVFLARALVQQGSIMLLDEPLTGIDSASQEVIMRLLLHLREQGKLIVMATHDLVAAAEVCDTCALLNHTLIAFGPAQQVLQPEILSATFGRRVLTLAGQDGQPATTMFLDQPV